MESRKYDRFDKEILRVLQADGRLTNQQIGETVHLSASQISRRRTRLEAEGVIRGYRAELNRDALGYGLTVFISVALATHNRDNARRFAELVGGMEPVLEAHALTGEMDYLLKVVVGDLRSLSELVNDKLLPHESVARVSSTICLDTIKESGSVPVY